MKTKSMGWRRGLAGLMLTAVGWGMAGTASAQAYNVFLKAPASTTPLICASGGFTFTKTGAGISATTGPSVTLSGCPTTFVPTIANGSYSTGTLNAVVEDVTINGQDQGPNVVGLTGALSFQTIDAGDCQGTGTDTQQKTYTITFGYASTAPTPNPAGRMYTIACSGNGNFSVSGNYHVNNTNTVPEPGSLWIALLGLGALFASRQVFLRRRGLVQAG